MAKLSVNEKFFQIWTPEMSYILGFIIADGCIIKRKGRKESYILNITSKDERHLFRVRKRLDSNHPIGSKYNSQRKVYHQIQFCNREVCKNLINLGVLPRKTYNLNPIEVPDKYFSDFMRGFFDGDGSVYIYEVNKTPQIKVGFTSSSLAFLAHFNRQLCNNLHIPEKSIHKEIDKRKNTMIRYNTCFYVDDCEKLAEFMYGNNPSLCLSRKRQIFEQWKFIKRRHYTKQNYPSKVGWRLNQKVFT